MALKPLNSVGGFSVGEIPANVILANADIISNNLTVQKIANLGPIGNVKITGGSANQYIQTDGFGNLTFTTADTSRILNGTSNVSIPAPNGNVNTSVNGNANIFVVTGTGANVDGYLTVTGNIIAANANLGNLVTGNYVNVAANTITSNLTVNLELQANTANFDGNVVMDSWLVVSNTANVGNLRTDNLLYANGTPWDFQYPAGANTYIQYNDNNDFGASANFTYNDATQQFTLLGNANITQTAKIYQEQLTSLTSTQIVYGNGSSFLVGSANFTFNDATNVLTVTGNVNATNTANVGNLNVNANVTSDLLPNANLSYDLGAPTQRWDNLYLGNANIASNVTSNNATINLELQANTANFDGNVVMDSWLVVSNTANVGNLRTDNLLYSNGQPWDLQQAAGANYEIQYNLNDDFSASANFTFNDTLQVLTVTGNANVTNTVNTPNVNSGTSDLTLSANGYSVILSATNGNANFPGNVTATTFYGNVNGNITTTAANTSVLYSDAGLIAGASGFTFDKVSNVFSTPGNITVNGDALVTGNANIANINITPNFITGDGTGIVVKDDTAGAQIEWNANSYVWVDSTGVNFETSNTYTANMDTAGNWNLPNNLSVVGNIANVNNISVTNNVNAVIGNFSGNINSLNANLGNLVEANYVNVASNLITNNANINLELSGNTANFSGNVILPNLTVNSELAGNTANFSGNVIMNNANINVALNGNTANFTGNISSLNANLGNLVDANYIRTQELYNGTANIGIINNGNITFSPTVGNVLVVSSVGANIVGYVQANGTGSFGAVEAISITSNVGNLLVQSEQSGNSYVQLRAFGNGTIDVGSTRITSLAEPNASSDAATKYYVDTVAQGLDVKDSVHAASYAAIANAYTYNNGTGGVGATLTANQNGILQLDGQTILLGERVLIKNEAGAYVNNTTPSAAFNGIYVCTTEGTAGAAWVLTRTADFDTAAEMYGAFTFVETGTNLADTGWVCTNNVINPITVGTTEINFSQFSGAGTYQAGSGLTLTGTVFSVNVDNNTTEISGGNVVVKPGANLTTPNIGAATGTSLDLTGNVLANNLNANSLVTAANIQVTGNVLAGNLLANSNVTSNNATVNLELSGNTANFTGAVILNSANVNLALNGNTANFSGAVVMNSANVNLALNGNTANFSGNVETNNLDVNLELSGNTANFTGAVILNSANVNLALNGNTANFSGNVIVPNLTVNLEFAGNTANFSGNINSALNANLGNLAQANYFTGILINGTSNAGIDGVNGNFNISVAGSANVLQITSSNANVTGGLNVTGNITANNFTSNTITANNKVDVGTTQIIYGNVTTSSITANQTIATVAIAGVTGVEWLVKGYDSSGSKYSMAIVTAVTDGTDADYSTFGTVNLGGTTGTLAVNVVGSNLDLQVTPASTNSTVWVTQFRTI